MLLVPARVLNHWVVSYSATCRLLPTGLLHPWDSSGKNTGVGCHFLHWGDLPDPGIELMSPTSPVLQMDSLLLSHGGSPAFLPQLKIKIKKWWLLPSLGFEWVSELQSKWASISFSPLALSSLSPLSQQGSLPHIGQSRSSCRMSTLWGKETLKYFRGRVYHFRLLHDIAFHYV